MKAHQALQDYLNKQGLQDKIRSLYEQAVKDAVQAGVITQEQADQILSNAVGGFGMRGFGDGGFPGMGGRGHGGRGFGARPGRRPSDSEQHHTLDLQVLTSLATQWPPSPLDLALHDSDAVPGSDLLPLAANTPIRLCSDPDV